jgi:hypothetical protein
VRTIEQHSFKTVAFLANRSLVHCSSEPSGFEELQEVCIATAHPDCANRVHMNSKPQHEEHTSFNRYSGRCWRVECVLREAYQPASTRPH